MFKSLFKKSEPSPEEVQALDDANIALRVRMDKIVRLDAPKHFGLAGKYATAIAA
jgi:hypothetical protein